MRALSAVVVALTLWIGSTATAQRRPGAGMYDRSKVQMIAGDELVMTADHLDRALRDVNPTLTPQWKTLLGHTYELGITMIDGAALNTMDVGSTLSRLQGVIRNELRRK